MGLINFYKILGSTLLSFNLTPALTLALFAVLEHLKFLPPASEQKGLEEDFAYMQESVC